MSDIINNEIKKERLLINNIPSILWGDPSTKLYIAVHGYMSNKEDKVIQLLSLHTNKSKYQLLSFDLPEHGDRKQNKNYPYCSVNIVNDLQSIMDYSTKKYSEINLWACSIGAFYSLIAYKNKNINQCIFLSPVVNLKIKIDYTMKIYNISENELENKKEITTQDGGKIYWDFYKFIKENIINDWKFKTYILYAEYDNIQSMKVIKDFCKLKNCELTVLEKGEHYFHTEDQLKYYDNWLTSIFKEK